MIDAPVEFILKDNAMSEQQRSKRGRRVLASAMLPGAKRDDVVRIGVVLVVRKLQNQTLANLQQTPTVLPEFVTCAITEVEFHQAVRDILLVAKRMASERNVLRFSNEVKCACA